MALKVTTIKEARLYPTASIMPMVAGGLDPDFLKPIFRHCRRGKIADCLPEIDPEIAPDRLEGTYFYAGVYAAHFGHMIAECVHRLWALERFGDDQPVVLLCGKPDDPWVKGYVSDLFSYFGVKQVKILTRPTRVENLIVAQQAKQLGKTAHPDYHQYLMRRAEDNAILDRPDMPKQIALLRDHLMFRRLTGESLFRDHLCAQGYQILKPEDHSLIDQLRFLANAKQIILADGSAGHLYDILPRTKARVFFYGHNRTSRLGPTSVEPKVMSFHADYDVAKVIVPLSGSQSRSPNRSLHYKPLSRLSQAMVDAGFITKPVEDAPASLVAHDVKEALDNRLSDLANGQKREDVAILEMARAHYETALRFYTLKRRTPWQRVWNWIQKKKRGL